MTVTELLLLVFEKKIVNTFVPASRIRSVNARPAPHLIYNQSTLHTSPLKIFHPLCYLLATVLHVQFVCSQVCVDIHIFVTIYGSFAVRCVLIYTYSSQYRDAGRAKEIGN